MIVRLVNTEKTIQKLTRERRRNYAVLGPTTTGTAFQADNDDGETIEEPELLLEVFATFSGQSLAAITADDNQDLNIFVLEGTNGYPTAASQETNLNLQEGNNMVFAHFQHRTTAAFGDATGQSNTADNRDHRHIWQNWAYLLEEDDTLGVVMSGNKTVTGTDWFNAQLTIITAVAPPRGV